MAIACPILLITPTTNTIFHLIYTVPVYVVYMYVYCHSIRIHAVWNNTKYAHGYAFRKLNVTLNGIWPVSQFYAGMRI